MASSNHTEAAVVHGAEDPAKGVRALKAQLSIYRELRPAQSLDLVLCG